MSRCEFSEELGMSDRWESRGVAVAPHDELCYT
jgi:hypothetical protein